MLGMVRPPDLDSSSMLALRSNDLPLSRERRVRCSLYLDRPAARRLQRLVSQPSKRTILRLRIADKPRTPAVVYLPRVMAFGTDRNRSRVKRNGQFWKTAPEPLRPIR